MRVMRESIVVASSLVSRWPKLSCCFCSFFCLPSQAHLRCNKRKLSPRLTTSLPLKRHCSKRVKPWLPLIHFFKGLQVTQVLDLGGPGSLAAVEDVLVLELSRQFGFTPQPAAAELPSSAAADAASRVA